ncbi:MAG: sigma-54 dependent transcriptional regulator, partial [Proteobacteria bacterium]|nr:sigma-54 dependent transcriptional regulator [Pseudomonadota bacterium]
NYYTVRRNILIVDDELVQAKVFEKFIKDMGQESIVMNNGSDVVDFFLNKKTIKNISVQDIDVMLLDLSMPDINGLTVLKQIASVKGDMQVIVLTGTNDINLAIKAINLGAFDYIVKGEKDVFARVIASINNAIEKRNLKYQVSNLERKDKDQVVFSDIIGNSEPIINAINLAKKVINSNIPVMLEGLGGTGKETFARAIHGSSSRSGKPFAIVDCRALKLNSADTILFGYERTADDGSLEKVVGKIREANGGTLFLDNVDALKMSTQAKLLYFIQEGVVEPIGSKTIYKANIRIISSTSKDLDALVKKGRFREDLFYRLSIFPIKIPTLKERGDEDIKLLAENFYYNFSVNENKKIRGISDEALQLLVNFDWERRAAPCVYYIFRAVILCDNELLKAKHFPQIVNVKNSVKIVPNAVEEVVADKDVELIDIFDERGVCKSLEFIEEEVVKRLVEFYGGNLSEVAKQLKVGRSTIYRKLRLSQSSTG